MITYERIKTICDPDGAPIYQQPWTTPDGKTAATEGHIAILVDAVFPETPALKSGARYPDLRMHFSDLGLKNEILDTSGIKIEKKTVDCWECDGTGVFSPCQECDGDGRHECSCGLSHDCGKCDGSGRGEPGTGGEECPYCDGTGEAEKYDPVKVGRWLFRGDLLEKIMALPGFKNLRSRPGKKCEPLAFDFDGGVGVIMPMADERRGSHEN